jgi:hypothetical protein
MQPDPVLLVALKDVQTRLGTVIHALEVLAPVPASTPASTVPSAGAVEASTATSPAPAPEVVTRTAEASNGPSPDPAKAPVKPAPAPVIHVPVPVGDHNPTSFGISAAASVTPIGDWIMPGLRRDLPKK